MYGVGVGWCGGGVHRCMVMGWGGVGVRYGMVWWDGVWDGLCLLSLLDM